MNLDQLSEIVTQLTQALWGVQQAVASGSTEVIAAAEQRLQQADLAYSQWLSNLPVPGGLGPGSAGRNLVLLFNPTLKDAFDRLDAARTQVQQMIDNGQIPESLKPTAQAAVATVAQTTQPQPGGGGGVGPMPDWQQFIIFVGALVVLWFSLSALSEAGFGKEANAFAGLLVVGALLTMGQKVIANAQALTKPRR